MRTKTTWAAVAAALLLGLAMGQATKPVEAARAPRSVMQQFVGGPVIVRSDGGSTAATLVGFDSTWVLVRTEAGATRAYSVANVEFVEAR